MEGNSLVPTSLHPGNGGLSTQSSSPGSSAFDLPTQDQRVAHGHHQPAPLRFAGESDASYIVISGGTGCNSICSAFGQNACYVLPVSDDGGSSSEIIRVIGGPSIGDIRSRLVRLIPESPPSSPLSSIRTLLAHRLPATVSEREARDEWRTIVEGKNPLWHGIPPDRKEAIRGFLVYFESEVLKRAHKNFSFRNGSVGNYLLAAAQGFFRSLPSAIFFFSSITNSQANILPVLVTNHTVTIAAELKDTSTIVGQCNISHPVRISPVSVTAPTPPDSDTDAVEDEQLSSQPQNVSFAKQADAGEEYSPLPAPISRLFYINAHGNEIRPSPNPEFLSQLDRRDVLVYSCGSLWTSIMPCLSLRGVAPAIARSMSLKAKILLLNSRNDRETDGFTAVDYIRAIVRTLRTADALRGSSAPSVPSQEYPTSAFITHLVYLKRSTIQVDIAEIRAEGVECIEIESHATRESGPASFDALALQVALSRILRDETLV